MRTIIDILKRGNLELFHSSMVAWLIDSKGEHEKGTSVLTKLAETLSRKGKPELEKALANGGGEVRTEVEVKRGNHRYDIWLKLPDTEVVFENKTKTVGNELQLQSYQEKEVIVVALGLCDESFADTVAEKFPLLTYKDVLAAIKATADDRVETGAFGTLVEQYTQYLERELEIIELVRNLILCPEEADRQFLAKKVGGQKLYDENSRRFWNMIILEQCRRILNKQEMWENTKWERNKDAQSGVWLAGLPCDFVFSEPLRQCAEDFGASLWFHAELRVDALMDPDTDKVGMLQLRSEVKDKRNKEFAKQFQEQYKASGNYRPANQIQQKWSTFYVVRRPLQADDLPGEGIAKALTEFAQTFQ